MIYIAGDHYAVELIQEIVSYLKTKNIAYKNFGATSSNEKISLQQIIPTVVQNIKADPDSSGILVCGTGIGVEIGANRFRSIRASLCRDAKQAEYARQYDNANVLCLASWFENDIPAILNAWLNTKFDNDPKRTQMLQDFDTWQ